jgi:putative membrane protein
MDNFYGGTLGLLGLGWVLVILFWIIIILGIVTLIRWLAGYGKNGHHHGCKFCEEKFHGHHWHENRQSEMEGRKDNEFVRILKERYAKGEINKEEFEQKKKDLM